MTSFAAPLSPLLHTLHATAPATRWLAACTNSETLLFVADTPHDWRYAVLQAVHELVEGALHRHYGLTRHAIDCADIDALDQHSTPYTRAHTAAVALETSLALALGIDHADYARVIEGRLRPRSYSRFAVVPSEQEEPLLRAVLGDVVGNRKPR